MAEDEMVTIANSVDMNLSKFWETVKSTEAWYAAVHVVTKRHNLVTEQQQFFFLDVIICVPILSCQR